MKKIVIGLLFYIQNFLFIMAELKNYGSANQSILKSFKIVYFPLFLIYCKICNQLIQLLINIMVEEVSFAYVIFWFLDPVLFLTNAN